MLKRLSTFALHAAKSPPLSSSPSPLAAPSRLRSEPCEDWCELPEREEQRPRSESSDPWLGEAAVELWLRLWPRLRRLAQEVGVPPREPSVTVPALPLTPTGDPAWIGRGGRACGKGQRAATRGVTIGTAAGAGTATVPQACGACASPPKLPPPPPEALHMLELHMHGLGLRRFSTRSRSSASESARRGQGSGWEG